MTDLTVLGFFLDLAVKQGFMGHPNRNIEASNAESDMDGRGPAEGTVISKCLEALMIFWQNASALRPCPKNLLETTLKNFGLMSRAEEIQDGQVLTRSYSY